MKLSTIEFRGYRRLVDAECNVDGKVIAFVGPNESGKSSVLQGLQWLTGDQRQLRLQERNRDQPPESETLVVRARYRIDEEDIEALQSLDLDVEPRISRESVTEFRVSRRVDGTFATGLATTLQRNPTVFKVAQAKTIQIEKLVEGAEALPDNERLGSVEETLRAASVLLDSSNPEWGQDRIDNLGKIRSAINQLVVNIEEIEDASDDHERLRIELTALERIVADSIEAGKLEDPATAIRRDLTARVPKFVLFSDDDRNIGESYILQDENFRANPPAPLRNLLYVAGTSVEEVWMRISNGDTASLRTYEKRLNRTLRERLQPMWSQSNLTVAVVLNVDGTLEVNIEELDNPDVSVTPIGERSDGLRAFLALVCFLIATDLAVPPVLMIDEAERNLHYDAQADLIRVLTSELRVHKVLYTTHSPGCLPLDLGTGIRVVVRDPDNRGKSTLSNNFWIRNDPGFSNLLFAMGAEAAAFSAFRRALLAEGVSEMILLPTMLRNATGAETLDFQVAFGLSSMSASKAVGAVALITTFLLDGDEAGDQKLKQLLVAGIPRSHIFQLPSGKALEDLVDRSTYLSVVEGLLLESGNSLDVDRLNPDLTIARAVDDYAKDALGIKGGVSHKIIAARLAENGPELRLTRDGSKYLKRLHGQIAAAFAHAYLLDDGTS